MIKKILALLLLLLLFSCAIFEDEHHHGHEMSTVKKIPVPLKYQEEVKQIEKKIIGFHSQLPPVLGPRHANLHVRLGVIYFTIGDLDKAQYNLERSIRMMFNNKEAHHYLGRVLYKKGHAKKAIEEYDIALKLDPSLDAAKKDLHEATRSLEEKNTEKN